MTQLDDNKEKYENVNSNEFEYTRPQTFCYAHPFASTQFDVQSNESNIIYLCQMNSIAYLIAQRIYSNWTRTNTKLSNTIKSHPMELFITVSAIKWLYTADCLLIKVARSFDNRNTIQKSNSRIFFIQKSFKFGQCYWKILHWKTQTENSN